MSIFKKAFILGALVLSVYAFSSYKFTNENLLAEAAMKAVIMQKTVSC
ncbi:hypothetical protein H1Q59_03235 [Holosporaceae bacterium 'Namur']|nr:hypothetical protein [Holosporaceae bacterium 'Namur']